MFYPKAKKGELTEDQKQVNDNLVVIAGSAAGGLASGSLSGVGSGANTAKNEVENNYLSDKDITTFTEKYAAAKTDAEKEQLVAALKKMDAVKQKQALSTGISIADQKTELEKLKQLVASPDCTGQCRELANYSISQLEPVVNNTQLLKDNFTKAVLASTIIALTLEQSWKTGEKAPATGTTSAGKSTSAIDDIVKGEGQAAKGTTGSPTGQQTKLTPEIETKILAGQRIDGSNKIIGGHSPNINDANPKYAVETIKVNADGT